MKKKLIAYLGSGSLTREDANMLTHVNVAFGKLEPDGTIREKTLAGDDIEKYKSWNPDLKFVLSLVQTQSNSFTSVCGNKEYMHRMGEEAVRIVSTTPFDGIDLDWEYPCVPSNGQDTCPEDKYRFTELLKTSDISVKEVGENVGYSNTSYFVKLFGSYYGLTPLQFRQSEDK